LGLAIGKWIAEAHGGQIQAGNASPHGAVFTVTLPLTRMATS
jgi:signal transduction histidine kinase